jgi:hypothetical protein
LGFGIADLKDNNPAFGHHLPTKRGAKNEPPYALLFLKIVNVVEINDFKN